MWTKYFNIKTQIERFSASTISVGESSAELSQIATVEALNAAAPELARQLREWVKTALNDELRRVRLAFDEQLRTADEHLARRLGNAESGGGAPVSRSSRSNSSRAKKWVYRKTMIFKVSEDLVKHLADLRV